MRIGGHISRTSHYNNVGKGKRSDKPKKNQKLEQKIKNQNLQAQGKSALCKEKLMAKQMEPCESIIPIELVAIMMHRQLMR